ncbi:Tim22-complex subunit TIM54 [Sporobolomyces salmoneus]|uniref:Tim22-complex subunit TIM54 n=1 Tax=Sporobolomyces salmoneus TaxID=183962 RepID=UPI0031743F22
MAEPTPPTPTTPPVDPVVQKPVVPGPTVRRLPPAAPKPTNPFVYLGIPQAVLDWRPSRPGPKMSVFLLFTASLTSLYAYDRYECKKLQKEYMDKVRWMSEQKLDSHEFPRKIKVLGARVPDDGELERGAKWFKRYMKPILVASGTDYALKIGTNPGGLARTLIHEIRGRRITKAANEIPGSVMLVNDAQSNVNAVLAEKDLEEEQREMDGATVILGRGALKEYLWALKKGYGEPIDLREEAKLEGLGLGNNERRKDGRWEREDELMSRELEKEDEKNPNNDPFEEKLPVGLQDLGVDDAESTSTESQSVNFLSYSPYRPITPTSTPSSSSSSSTSEPESPLVLPGSEVPPQPPLLLVPFTYPFGIRTWPSKLAHFWNHRQDVKLGGEYALALLLSQTRPFDSPKLRTPEGTLQGLVDENLVASVRRGELHETTMEEGVPTGSKDLDFLFDLEERPEHFKKGYRTMPKGHEYHRRTYYTDDLPPRLKTARELASGERERTSAEESYPPKIESELRKERLDKELRWRRELEGWGIQRAGSGVAWTEGTEDKLKVIEAPVDERGIEELKRRAQEWEETKKRVEEDRERMWKEDVRSTVDEENV